MYGGIQTSATVVALAASIGVAVARFAQRNAPDGGCRADFAGDVGNLRPTYDSAVTAAMQVSGGDLDVRTINMLTARCKVDSRFLGEIAEYGVRPSSEAARGEVAQAIASDMAKAAAAQSAATPADWPANWPAAAAPIMEQMRFHERKARSLNKEYWRLSDRQGERISVAERTANGKRMRALSEQERNHNDRAREQQMKLRASFPAFGRALGVPPIYREYEAWLDCPRRGDYCAPAGSLQPESQKAKVRERRRQSEPVLDNSELLRAMTALKRVGDSEKAKREAERATEGENPCPGSGNCR